MRTQISVLITKAPIPAHDRSSREFLLWSGREVVGEHETAKDTPASWIRLILAEVVVGRGQREVDEAAQRAISGVAIVEPRQKGGGEGDEQSLEGQDRTRVRVNRPGLDLTGSNWSMSDNQWIKTRLDPVSQD